MSDFFFFFLYIHIQWYSNKNRPQHPDVYVHNLKSDLTAYWLNRALGLLHCRGKTPRTTPVYTSHTVAMEKINTDGFRARLWSHSGHILFYPLYISSHMNRLSIPKLQGNNHDGQRALRHYWGQFFTYYKIMRAQWHAGFVLHRSFKVFKEERPEHSHILLDLIWSSCIVVFLFRMTYKTQSSHSTYNS